MLSLSSAFLPGRRIKINIHWQTLSLMRILSHVDLFFPFFSLLYFNWYDSWQVSRWFKGDSFLWSCFYPVIIYLHAILYGTIIQVKLLEFFFLCLWNIDTKPELILFYAFRQKQMFHCSDYDTGYIHSLWRQEVAMEDKRKLYALCY